MAATYMIVTNASANTLSLEGDDRNPSLSIARSHTANINIIDVLGNALLCDSLSAMVTAGTVTITRGGTTVTATQLTAYKQGADMDRTDYDADDDNVIDKAEQVDTSSRTPVDFAASPYTVLAGDSLIQTDSSGGAIGLTLPAGVDGKTYIVKDGTGDAATDAVTLTPDGAETIEGAATYVLDTARAAVQLYYDAASTDWKLLDIAGIDPTDVVTNTTRTSNWLAGNVPAETDVNNAASPYTVLATDVVLSVLSTTGVVETLLPVGINGKTFIIMDSDGDAGTNTITITPNGAETIEGAASLTLTHDSDSVKLVYDLTDTDWKVLTRVNNMPISDKLVEVVITAVGGVGGATAGTISVQVNDLDGNAVTRVVNIVLDSSLTQFAGPLVASGTAFFGAATTGATVFGGGALTALVTTDATGLYEGALADAADETAWFSARTAPGGSTALTGGCSVTGCIPDDAAWSA